MKQPRYIWDVKSALLLFTSDPQITEHTLVVVVEKIHKLPCITITFAKVAERNHIQKMQVAVTLLEQTKGSQEEASRHPFFLRFYHPGFIQLGMGSCFSLIGYLASHKVNFTFALQNFYHLSNQAVNDWFPKNQIPQVGLWWADRYSVAGLIIWFSSIYQGRAYILSHIYHSNNDKSMSFLCLSQTWKIKSQRHWYAT